MLARLPIFVKRRKGKGETMEKSDTAAIDKYIEAVGAAYSAEVSLLNPFKTSILQIRSVIANTMRNIALCCIFIAALCIVIYRQTRSRRYSLRWTGCGTTAAGVCLLTVPALFNTSIASGDYTLSKNAKLLEAGISRSFCATAVVCGIVFVLIGGAILFTGIFINKRSRSRRI